MVKIRLRRMGKKKAPVYRIIVADARSPRDGRFIEEIGTYDPSQEPSAYRIDEEAAKKWLANSGGCQASEDRRHSEIIRTRNLSGKLEVLHERVSRDHREGSCRAS